MRVVLAALPALVVAVTVAAEPRIVATWTVPRTPLEDGVFLGGLSDLASRPSDDGPLTVWTLTDRGPNGTETLAGTKVRTLLAPDFAPVLVRMRLDRDAEAAKVEQVVPLRGADGRPLSGRPPEGDAIVSAADPRPVACDPCGVDPEALVTLADGTFWIAEEYRPSLLHVAADGRVLTRYVPVGAAAAPIDREVLPAIYAARRDNRGFEALALRPDGLRLWALLQSPLDAPGRSAGKRTGNVRLLAVDPVAGVPVAEHVYRLGDPTDPAFLTRGAPPDDGKLCAMAALDADSLLVLEQDDDGLARLYAADLAEATDTLGREFPDGTLEQLADLSAAGVMPVTKTLVADLTALRDRMRTECDGGESQRGGALKLEGLAIVSERRVALVNDDDFAVPQAATGRPGRGCRLWIVELPANLPDYRGGVTASPAAR